MSLVAASHATLASLGFQNGQLLMRGIDKPERTCTTVSEAFVEWRAMLIAPAFYLRNETIMAEEQGPQSAFPSFHFRVTAVSPPVRGEDHPNGVQFTMLTQKVLTAQSFRADIPDAHTLKSYAPAIG